MNILIIKLSAIGDVIHALSVPHFIKQTYNNAHISWAVEKAAAPLVEACPDVDEVIVVPKKEIRSLKGFIKNIKPLKQSLNTRKYDYSLDLQGLLKSALMAKLANAKIKLGTANMREGSSFVSKSIKGEHKNGHIVEQYLDVARAIGAKGEPKGFTLNVPAESKTKVDNILKKIAGKFDLNSENLKYAALVIGGNWPNKRWGAENFAKLSDALYEKSIIPVLFGAGKTDEDTRNEIFKLTNKKPVDLINETSLLDAAELLSKAAIAIGGDTGLMHMAAGLSTKCVMLMGPTNKERNGPFLQAENAIETNRNCKGCWKRNCPKNLDCLNKISLEQVLNKVSEILCKLPITPI